MTDTAAEELHLGIICSQYDRQGQAGSVERLISLLSAMNGIRATLVVVDNANPGSWHREVTRDLIHLGGDNTFREFSAFDRGLEFLRERYPKIQVYCFATDAFRAYGVEFLDLIDERTIHQSLDMDCCIGWIDTFGEGVSALGRDYEWWIRTSLFFLPASRVEQLQPLTTPVDEERIFDVDGGQPFTSDSPLSENLQQHLLAWLTDSETRIQREEAWHSRFTFGPDTAELFRAKVTAILREQLLSARCAELGIPCVDFRLASELARKGIDGRDVTARDLASWQGLGFRSATILQPLRYAIDKFLVPEKVIHGREAEILVDGWVASTPKTQEIRLHLGPLHVLGARTDVARPDVAQHLGELDGTVHGFEIRGALETLPPGHYAVEVSFAGTEIRRPLGSFQVSPRCEFLPDRIFVPQAAPTGEPFVLAVEGRLMTSDGLADVEAQWNSRPAPLDIQWTNERRRANGLWVYDVAVQGSVAFEEAPQSALSLIFHTLDGSAATWQHFEVIRAEDQPPVLISERLIGPIHPRTGETDVYIEGALWTSGSAGQLHLLQGDRVLLSQPLDDASEGVCWFEIRRRVAGISPGTSEFSLALGPLGDVGYDQQQFRRSLRTGEAIRLDQWRSRVELQVPKVQVDRCEIKPSKEKAKSQRLLSLEGWVEHHALVTDMVLTANGERLCDVRFNRHRPDVARALGRTLVERQGFVAVTPLDSKLASDDLELALCIRDGQRVVWRKTLEAEELEYEQPRVESPRLLQLAADETTTFWCSIHFEGFVLGPAKGVVATLFVDGKDVVRQDLWTDGSFDLRFVPPNSGRYRVRVVLDRGKRSVYDSGSVEVRFERSEVPAASLEILSLFLDRFGLRAHLGFGSEGEQIREYFERDLNMLPDKLAKLGGIESALHSPVGPPPDQAADTAPTGDSVRRLRVLFVAWNVPCLRHGGGVWMANLLRVLGQRHEITVIYCYSPGEEKQGDDIRPFVDRVIAIPRRFHLVDPGDGPIFEQPVQYVPELHAAVDLEARSGRYDLVDYQYAGMLPHVSKAHLPRVLTVFEEGFSARTNSAFPATACSREKLDELEELIDAFHFTSVELPGRFDHLIAVTDEDAQVMARHQTQARIHVNRIGIDTEEFDSFESRDDEAPSLVFLGNFQHPPSVHAALYCAQKILPRVRRTHPEVELILVGANPTSELLELDSEPAITVTGFVEDYRPYFYRATAFLAPIFTGSGMRVKVLEAMACCVPVIATDLAVRGIGAMPEDHYFAAVTADDFVAATRFVLESPERARAVGRSAHDLIASDHSHLTRAREREAIWMRVINDFANRQKQRGTP